MKKISIIAPNVLIGEIKHKLQQTKECLAGYEVNFILVASKKEKLSFEKTEIILCDSLTKTNDQITMGFKSLGETDCALVCDYNQKNYLEYIKALVSCWEKGAKIVRLQYENGRKNIWQKIGNFFYRLRMKMYQFMLKVFGLNKFCECYNLFQLFDNEVLDLFKTLPQKNALLRNYDVMKNFYSLTVTTDEKLKFKKDKFVWKGTMTASLVLFLVFAGMLVGGIFLEPLASEKGAPYTYICLLVVLLFGLLSLSTYFFVVSVLDYKYGAKKEKVIVVDEKQKENKKNNQKANSKKSSKKSEKAKPVNLIKEAEKKEKAKKSNKKKK